MNRQIPLMGIAPNPRWVSEQELSACNDMLDAVLLCIRSGQVKYSNAVLAELIGIDRGQLSKILNRKGYNYPIQKLGLLMDVCSNYAPMQYLLKEQGFAAVLSIMEQMKAA